MATILRERFYFVRHGKTAWNDQQLCQGQMDIELNESGRQEAKLLGEKLKGLPISIICASPLLRASETATLIQQYLPCTKLYLIDELKERFWGELEGISSAEMYQIELNEESDLSFKLEKGVEPRDLFKSRIANGINKSLKKGKDPLIVSHGRVFLCLCELLGLPLIRQIPNATLMECFPSESSWHVNQISLLI